MIGPVRRYNRRYNNTAERVVLFKHLISCGFPIETGSSLVKTITVSNRVSLVTLPLAKGIESQLRKTVEPTTYNRKIASLIWLFSHITAYCTLRQLKNEYVQMGDSTDDITCDGIYVFDQDYIGFRLSQTPEFSITSTAAKAGASGTAAAAAAAPAATAGARATAASAYMPFAQIMELLTLRDSAQERLCQQDHESRS